MVNAKRSSGSFNSNLLYLPLLSLNNKKLNLVSQPDFLQLMISGILQNLWANRSSGTLILVDLWSIQPSKKAIIGARKLPSYPILTEIENGGKLKYKFLIKWGIISLRGLFRYLSRSSGCWSCFKRNQHHFSYSSEKTMRYQLIAITLLSLSLLLISSNQLQISQTWKMRL